MRKNKKPIPPKIDGNQVHARKHRGSQDGMAANELHASTTINSSLRPSSSARELFLERRIVRFSRRRCQHGEQDEGERARARLALGGCALLALWSRTPSRFECCRRADNILFHTVTCANRDISLSPFQFHTLSSVTSKKTTTLCTYAHRNTDTKMFILTYKLRRYKICGGVNGFALSSEISTRRRATSRPGGAVAPIR